MPAREPSPSSAAWHCVYETLELGKLNPICPYFQLIEQAIRFTGELEGQYSFIHPARHYLARQLLKAPELVALEATFRDWQHDLGLSGARPYGHGSASLILDIHPDLVIELCETKKQKTPAIPIMLIPILEIQVGKFRMGIEEKCTPTIVSAEELALMNEIAKVYGHYIADPFRGNFGRTSRGEVKIVDSDAVKPIGS